VEGSSAVDSLHGRFVAMARTQPDAPALRADGRTVTYGQLDAASDRLAGALERAGTPRGSLVGLVLERGLAIPVAILGVLKHGCAYVPVDPGYPPERQDQLLGDARVRYVVRAADPDDLDPIVVETGIDQEPWDLPEDVAYAIYTSGSTGRPKGVLVGHRHVLALFDAAESPPRPSFGLGPSDVVTLFHSYCFDVSVWEFWGALLFGGTAVVVRLSHVQDQSAFADLLAAERVTMLNQVPTIFGYLVRALEEAPRPLPALRHVILAGEAVDLAAVQRWRSLGCAPGARVINMYGPTETTVFSTYRMLTEADRGGTGRTPIGPPLPHLRARLVDDDLRPVPQGEPGELLIAGRGVSYGYLGRPELTAQRFVTLPDTDGLWYRTGDWAIEAPDGDLLYLGRRDDQVKVRGVRIELGEVEAALREHADVVACAVSVTRNRLGEPVLVAHYVPRQEGTDLGRSLRSHLRMKLPRDLVPVSYRPLVRLPLTVSGKVDRQALIA
jgi:D-alanine--poly(phosphoribitol) ligase subunit 1